MKLLLFKYYQIPPEKRLIIDQIFNMVFSMCCAIGIVIVLVIVAAKYSKREKPFSTLERVEFKPY